jgi:hypothetical protein
MLDVNAGVNIANRDLTITRFHLTIHLTIQWLTLPRLKVRQVLNG